MVKKLNINKLKEVLEINELIWDNLPTMSQFVATLNSMKNTLFREVSDNNFDDLKEFEIIAGLPINKKLKNETLGYANSNFYLFLISNHTSLYLSLSVTPKDYWYSCRSIKELKRFLFDAKSIYNPTEYLTTFTNQISAVIAYKEDHDMIDQITEIEKNLILNRYSEVLTWGSFWDDYPFRDKFNNLDKLTNHDRLTLSTIAMKQKDGQYTVSIRSLFSKSIIKLSWHNRLYTVDVFYEPIENEQIKNINKTFNKYFPLNMPLDVILMLKEYNFYDFRYYLEEMNEQNMTLACYLANQDDEFEEIKKTLLHKYKEEETEEQKEIIKYFIDQLNANKITKTIINNMNLNKEFNIEKYLKKEKLTEDVVNMIKSNLNAIFNSY